VTLHVGPGTFLPVRSENIAEHRMHAERFSVSPEAADKINNAQRIVAVGTTAMRVLETATRDTKLVSRQVEPQSGETDLFFIRRLRFELSTRC
jgi:S-adenosylmethionine:tRNA-ribosyltransferase-isomerase (queuine synthetase)